MKTILKIIPFVMLILIMVACQVPAVPLATQAEVTTLPEQVENQQLAVDMTYVEKEGVKVIYLAGGCFWGMEKLMQSMPGVLNVVSGYANGSADITPTYNIVVSGNTGYRETVRVEYDPNLISLDALLFAYFAVIDPSIENAQGNDRGTQYQTGVYYVGEANKETVERIAAIEMERNPKFVVELKPLERFYDAEEYHQNYLDKNPSGYCHIPSDEMSEISQLRIDPGNYPRPEKQKIKGMLTELQYEVTQNAATEPPFDNEYVNNHERGIYVDVVTGEPLFSSSDKFESGTGWPSFTQPIDQNAVRFITDSTLGMQRVEVRSRAGNSHLGHLFRNDPVSPNGIRYCMNSAALRFVAYEDMPSKGYAYLLDYVK